MGHSWGCGLIRHVFTLTVSKLESTRLKPIHKCGNDGNDDGNDDDDDDDDDNLCLKMTVNI